MRFSSIAVFAACFAGFSSFAFGSEMRKLSKKQGEEKKGNENKQECPSGADGYKQVNALVSQANTDLAKDGTLLNLCLYNNGLPAQDDLAKECTLGVADPNNCSRTWDPSETPAGILAEAICTGNFKWCVHENDLGDNIETEAIVIATEDNFLEGIMVGDLSGGYVSYFKAMTNQISKILRTPLAMELVIIEDDGGGIFEDTVVAMGKDRCFASADYYFRHPYRESRADFTCPTFFVPPSGFAILAQADDAIDLEAVFGNGGEGVTVCTSAFSTQDTLARRDLPKATLFSVASINDVVSALCDGKCEVIVDEVAQAESGFLKNSGCKGLLDNFGIAAPSSAGDGGAITYRAS